MAITHNSIPNHAPEVVPAAPDSPRFDTADAIMQITDREHILISDNNAQEVVSRAIHLAAVSRARARQKPGADVIPLKPNQN